MASSPSARAPVFGAFLEGWRRVLQAPWVLVSVCVLTFLMALPMALTLKGMIGDHLGASAEADRAAAGWNAAWAGEFAQQAQGIGKTFTSDILGFGGTL